MPDDGVQRDSRQSGERGRPDAGAGAEATTLTGATRRNRVLLVVAVVLVLALLASARLLSDGAVDDDGAGPSATPATTSEDDLADDDGAGANDEPGDADDAGRGEAAGPDGTGEGTGGDPDLPSAPIPQPAPDPDDPDAAAEAAQATLIHYLKLADLAYASPDRTVDLQEVATGSAAAEVEAIASEFAATGLRQRGEVRIETVSVEEAVLDGEPPSLTLLACLDATRVSLLDADGAVVRPPSPESRSLHRYDLVHQAERWAIIRHALPDDADC